MLSKSIILILSCSFVVTESKNYSWDYLMFAQIWPESTCLVANEAHNDSCTVPQGVSSWTIHGLWPSLFDGEQGPYFCPGQQRHFNVSNLDAIIKVLELRWPNLISDASVASLWKHEWTKHGSCAVQLKTLDSEINYFQAGLLFNTNFDILKALTSGNIVPSDTATYTLSDFETNLQNLLHKPFLVHCLFSKIDQKWYFSDVRICLDKEFKLIECSRKFFHSIYQSDIYSDSPLPTPEICPKDKPLHYPTIKSGLGASDSYYQEL